MYVFATAKRRVFCMSYGLNGIEVSKVAVNILNNEQRTARKVWYSGLSKIIFEKKYSSIDSQILSALMFIRPCIIVTTEE